jgi:hypothetical protein
MSDNSPQYHRNQLKRLLFAAKLLLWGVTPISLWLAWLVFTWLSTKLSDNGFAQLQAISRIETGARIILFALCILGSLFTITTSRRQIIAIREALRAGIASLSMAAEAEESLNQLRALLKQQQDSQLATASVVDELRAELNEYRRAIAKKDSQLESSGLRLKETAKERDKLRQRAEQQEVHLETLTKQLATATTLQRHTLPLADAELNTRGRSASDHNRAPDRAIQHGKKTAGFTANSEREASLLAQTINRLSPGLRPANRAQDESSIWTVLQERKKRMLFEPRSGETRHYKHLSRLSTDPMDSDLILETVLLTERSWQQADLQSDMSRSLLRSLERLGISNDAINRIKSLDVSRGVDNQIELIRAQW